MRRIFDEERRRDGGFWRNIHGVPPRTSRNGTKMLEGGQYRLSPFSCSGTTVVANETCR